MWFITALVVENDCIEVPASLVGSQRTFGFYREELDAREAIAKNEGNMHECLYNYLVLEEIGEGIHALVEDGSTKWFHWDDKWVPCEQPEDLKGIINFALG